MLLVGLVALVVLPLIGTAIAGGRGSDEREALVRARVWCESLVSRDPLRYQETFRRGYFQGTFDRVKNLYLEPTEAAILRQMPRAASCEIDGPPRRGGPGEMFVPVIRASASGQQVKVDLRMRREAGFWVVYQLVPRS